MNDRPVALRPRIQGGFTLVEMVIALVIIAVMAAILTPVIGGMIDSARATRARRDGQTIADAVLSFNKDTGRWPIFTAGTNITSSSAVFGVLVGPGNDPTCASPADCSLWTPTDATTRGDLGAILERNTPAYVTTGQFAWRGPYTSNLPPDPWGNKYIVNASSLGFGLNRAAFVLSAGPNSIIETAFTQNIGSGSSAVVVGGDDIAVRMR